MKINSYFNKIVFRKIILSLAAGCLSITAASAQILTETDTTSSTGFTISTSADLIYQQTATITSGSFFNLYGGGDTGATALADLTDGVSPATLNGDALSSGTGFAGTQNGLVLTFNLTSPSTVNEIDVYTGWADNGRANANFTLSYSTDGTDFTTLNTVAATGPNTDPSDLEVTLTGTLSNVEAVRFSFNNQENGGAGLDEIAVLGTAAAPEPSVWALMFAGLTVLVFLKRRKRIA